MTPGWIGFTATALVGAVIILLLFDFNRRVRRINNRAEAKERIEAELAARDAALEGAEPPLDERAGGDAEQDRAADDGNRTFLQLTPEDTCGGFGRRRAVGARRFAVHLQRRKGIAQVSHS